MMQRLFFLLFTIFITLCLKAQTAIDSAGNADTVNLKIMQDLLLKSETLRIRDSLRSALLYEELKMMKNPNQAQQQAMLQEIMQLKQQDSLRGVQQKMAVEALRPQTTGAPVLLHKDTLFLFFAPLGSFTAANRAQDASDRIYGLYKQGKYAADSLHFTYQNNLVNIHYGDQVITSLSNVDALWADKPLDALAMEYTQLIGAKVAHDRKEFSWQNTVARIGYLALVISIVFGLLWLIHRSHQWSLKWIASKKEVIKGVKIKKYELFSPGNLLHLLQQLTGIVRVILIVLVLYFALSAGFSIFPLTHSWTSILLGWIWMPVKQMSMAIVHYLPNLVTIIVIILLVRFVLRILRFFSLEIERDILHIKGFHKEWAKPTYNIVRFFIFAFSFVVIFPYLPGSDSVAFKGVSVFLGILFSIGSSSAIANTVAGFVITYMRPFKTGDWIKVNDITGYVVEKTALVTRIRTFYNEEVTIPNSSILSNHTINYSTSPKEMGLILTTVVTIGYDVSWEVVYPLLIKSAMMTPGVDTGQSPFVFQQSFNDYHISYQLNVYTHNPELMFPIQSDLNRNIQTCFDEAGISILSPQPIQLKSS